MTKLRTLKIHIRLINMSQSNPKIVFARRAATAQRVEGADIQTTLTGSTPQLLPVTKHITAIKSPRRKPGRKAALPTHNLPRGYRTLRRGLVTYSQELGDKFVEAYYNAAGSLTRACRDVGVAYHAALKWRDEIPQFTSALREVDEIIKDEAHSQFMDRVLTTWESNPTWKLTYFKKHFPQYSAQPKSTKFTFNISDSLIKPDIIEGQVIPPKQLEAENETRPKQDLDPPTDAGEVS